MHPDSHADFTLILVTHLNTSLNMAAALPYISILSLEDISRQKLLIKTAIHKDPPDNPHNRSTGNILYLQDTLKCSLPMAWQLRAL